MEETVMSTASTGTIAPEKILRELAEMWTALSHDPTGEGDGALRACSMTLVTLAEEAEDFSALGEIIAALMPEHPARTLVVRLQGAGERQLGERVYSQCWKPFGQKRQVCCEQVEITASDSALGDLPSVILPLAVPDLPLIVWCRSARVAAMPEFGAIAAMAQRVIVDGKEVPPVREALALIAGIAAHGARVADLAWTRLTRWRAVLSQVFENRQNLAELPRISKVTVTTNGEPPLSACYFGAWVMDILDDIGVHPEFHLERSGGDSSGELHSIELAAPGWSAELSRSDGRLIVTVGGLAQCNPLRPSTDFSLMEEELRITGRDSVFERAFASGQRLCGAEK
jgi:glucose-6-phosphate dehydrogenase assembly protein OpcA